MDEPRSAQRYLEDLTPGGSEYFNNPKRCYEWISHRQSENQRLLTQACWERNRLQDEVGRLTEQLRIAEAALAEVVRRPLSPTIRTIATAALNELHAEE